MKKLFREIIIWETVDDNLVIRYRCFEDLSESKFFVIASNYFHETFDEKQWKEFDIYFYESISSEVLIEMATESCETLEKAIEKHNADFENVRKEFKELKEVKLS
jgi:hypothetical protein